MPPTTEERPRVRTLAAPALLCALTLFVPANGFAGPYARASEGSPAGPVDPELEAARRLLAEGKIQQAQTEARALLARVESAPGPESIEAARVLDLLVAAELAGGTSDLTGVAARAGRAVAIMERILGPENLELTSPLTTLGGILRRQSDLAGARALYDQVLAIREARLGPSDPAVAEALGNVASILMDQGDLKGAMPLQQRALEIRRAALPPDHLDLALGHHNLGTLLRNSGEYAAALDHHQTALAIREKRLPADHPDLATNLNNIGELLLRMGDFGLAERYLERAARIREAHKSPDYLRLTEVLNNLAELRTSMGDFSAARPIYERALALRRKHAGEEHPYTALIHNSYGGFLESIGELQEARAHYEQALAIWEKHWGPGHALVAVGLQDLAGVLDRLNQPERARQMYERAIDIWEQVSSGRHPAAAACLNGLANLHRDQGNLDEAAGMYERALQIRTMALGSEHPSTALTRIDRARLQWAAGRTSEGLEDALQGEASLTRHLRTSARSLSERQALGYEASRSEGADVALSIMGSPARSGIPATEVTRVWEQIARSRALVLDEMAARQRAGLSGESAAVDRLWKNLETARRRYAHLTVGGPDPRDPRGYRPALDRLREEMEQAERALAAGSSTFRDETATRAAGLARILAALPEGAVLAAYVAYDRLERSGGIASGAPHYLALVGGASVTPAALVALGPAGPIEAAIARWKEAVSTPPRDAAAQRRYGEAAGEVERLVWKPIAALIGDARQVFIVPDGAMHLLNFSTLPDGAGGYLIETGPVIHLLSAERDLLRPVRASPGSGLLAIGGPDYDAASGAAAASPASQDERPRSSPCDAMQGLRFSTLAGASAEVEEVESLWRPRQASVGDVLTLRGPQATEAAVKKLASGRRVLHLATHAFFVERPCEPLAGGNPFHLAGLALAGANHRGQGPVAPGSEDGILTAEEIASLDLRGVEWAVLSACETGLGTVLPGEGVLGLRRSFEVAGAGSLILSLWSVSDLEARAWIKELYKARLEGLSTAEAVRRAGALRLRARRAAGVVPHPYFWGAFVATGDWR